MDTIIVNVKELYETVKLMHDDKMDFVELSLLDPDKMPDGDPIPASVFFSAWTKGESFMTIDYDGVDAVDSE